MTESWQRLVDQANMHAGSVPVDWKSINKGIDRGLARRNRFRRRLSYGAALGLAAAASVAVVTLWPQDPDPIVIEPAAPFTKSSVRALRTDCEQSLSGNRATESVAAMSKDKTIAVALVRNDSDALMCMRDDANSAEASVTPVTINPAPKNGDDLAISTISTPNNKVYAAAAVVPDVAFLARTYGEAESARGLEEARRNSDTLALNVLTFEGRLPAGEIDLSVFWYPDKAGDDCGCEEVLATISRPLASMPLVTPTQTIP